MPRIRLNQLSTSALKSDQDLFSQLRTILDDAERQFANQTLVVSRSDEKNETGMRRGDIIIRLVNDVLKIGFWTGKRNRYLTAADIGALTRHNTNFTGFHQNTLVFSAAAVRTNYFPNHGDWGFYKNTAVPTFHLIFNDNGVTQAVAM